MYSFCQWIHNKIKECMMYSFCQWIHNKIKECMMHCFCQWIHNKIKECMMYSFCQWMHNKIKECMMYSFCQWIHNKIEECMMYSFCQWVHNKIKECMIYDVFIPFAFLFTRIWRCRTQVQALTPYHPPWSHSKYRQAIMLSYAAQPCATLWQEPYVFPEHMSWSPAGTWLRNLGVLEWDKSTVCGLHFNKLKWISSEFCGWVSKV